MSSGKSKSVANPDGIRRTVNGNELPPKSKRTNPEIVKNPNEWRNGWKNPTEKPEDRLLTVHKEKSRD